MTAKLKSSRLAACAGLLLLCAGCGGLHATKSISPIDFLVPGGGSLLRGLLYEPAPTLTNSTVAIIPQAASPTQVASVQ